MVFSSNYCPSCANHELGHEMEWEWREKEWEWHEMEWEWCEIEWKWREMEWEWCRIEWEWCEIDWERHEIEWEWHEIGRAGCPLCKADSFRIECDLVWEEVKEDLHFRICSNPSHTEMKHCLAYIPIIYTMLHLRPHRHRMMRLLLQNASPQSCK